MDASDAVRDAEVVLVGVPDNAIEEVVGSVAPALRSDTVIVHFAGSFGLSVLSPASRVGALGVALHPVQACPDIDTAIARLPGSAWGITVGDTIEEWARTLVADDLGGTPVIVAEESRPVWHAAAVMTSNGTAALLAIGEALLGSISVDNPEQVLGPLAQGTVQNAIEGAGGGATLTGPIVRDEIDTVMRHLRAIEEREATLVPGFVAGTRLIVEAAAAAGRLSEERAVGWRQTLESGS